jgi:hypothetical protein
MRRYRLWRRYGLSARVREELEHWLSVLLTVAAALLLFAALRGQVARADAVSSALCQIEITMAAAARSTALHEAPMHAVLAPGMPPGD